MHVTTIFSRLLRLGLRVAALYLVAVAPVTAAVGSQPQPNLTLPLAAPLTAGFINDPFVQEEAPVAVEPLAPSQDFGYSVALSSDGQTALIGSKEKGGQAWVFVRSGSGWTEQAVLRGREEAPEALFGWSVALSGDGRTALVGAAGEGEFSGAAWVFVRSGTTWKQQGPKLNPTDIEGHANFGLDVALSEDGNTALIAGPDGADNGAIWTFTRGGEDWSQLGTKLVKGNHICFIGGGIALSGDGHTAFIGEPCSESLSLFAYHRNGNGWTEQEQLFPTGLGSETWYTSGVSASADGKTVIVSASGEEQKSGAAVVFAESEDHWVQQGAPLRGTGETGEGYFGNSTALSASGNEALVAAFADGFGNGAVWLFRRVEGVWREQERLSSDAGPGSHFGTGVALSADASTALVGSEDGRVFTFGHPVPLVSTGAASEVGQTSARLNGTVDTRGAVTTDCKLEYGPTNSYGSSIPCEPWPRPKGGAVTVEAAVAALTPGTDYHFRIDAASPAGTSYGPDGTFATVPSAPSVQSEPATDVGTTIARLNARIDPNGGAINSCSFEFGPTSAYGHSLPCSAAGQMGPASIVYALAPVTVGANYHFRAVATNAGGTGYGNDATFHTPAAARPRIKAHVTWNLAVSHGRAVVLALTAKQVPVGAKIRIGCDGHGCPFAHRALTVVCKACHGIGTAVLAPLFHRRALSPVVRISIEIYKPGMVGEREILVIARRGQATLSSRCTTPPPHLTLIVCPSGS